jgi:uncharacterized protein
MMIRRCVQCFVLAAACAISLSARAQAVASPRPESNPAPGMKVQVLSRDSQQTTYAVIFGKGDEVMAGLTEFAQKYHLGASRITGIGGTDDATIGFFDRQKKAHRPIPIHQQAEVLSLLGDIALFHGKPVVHLHIVLGFPDGSAHGGHLLNAHVWPTMEVIVTEYPNAMHKKLDMETGVAVIDPSVKQ